VTTQRYVHPSSEAVELAIERLESVNDKVAKVAKALEAGKRRLPATVSATSETAIVGDSR
jgi:hypothetical protein